MNDNCNSDGNSNAPENVGGDISQVENQRAQTYPGGERKGTQEEQSKVDEEKKKEALKGLVASWMDRLQIISVITTFFASMEAMLLSITTRDVKDQTGIEQATNAAFLGALVLHGSAASFFLVNYKVHEARKEEVQAEGGMFIEMPFSIFEAAADPRFRSDNNMVFRTSPRLGRTPVNKVVDPLIWSSNPHLVQVGPFHGQPPTNVLGRCYSLSVFLASVGFVFAMVGIGCFAWARHPMGASIFCTIWIGICVMFGVGILVVPDIKLGINAGNPICHPKRVQHSISLSRNSMNDPYTQFGPHRTLRKVKRFPVLPRGIPDLSGTDEPLYLQAHNQIDDDQKRQKAIEDLVTVWQQRLQLMTAISTFFASTESGLLGLVTKSVSTPTSTIVQIANATLLGALIIHVFSAFVAFVASFVLVDYRIHETETELPRGMPRSVKGKSEKHHHRHGRSISISHDLPMPSADPHLVQVGPFKKKPPLHMLGRCHSLCVTLSSTGFLLAFIGVCCFAWTEHRSVSIFATVCIGLCFVMCVGVFGLFDTQSIVIKVNVSIT
ncbi:hypothetical protein AX15_006857 [Amanita polypyramis BW_CC]|nr:hypothetical protein AX15_006857 [Amanita polypyramis BW_CC]